VEQHRHDDITGADTSALDSGRAAVRADSLRVNLCTGAGIELRRIHADVFCIIAGLLWRDILQQKGIHVRRVQFALLNVGTFLVATAASSAVLIGQAYVVHQRN